MVALGVLFLELIFYFADGLHKFTVRLDDDLGDGFIA